MTENRSTRLNKLPRHEIPITIRNIVKHDLQPWPEMTALCELLRNLLETMMETDEFELDESHYVDYLRIFLYVEEVHNEMELRKYDMHDQTIEIKWNLEKIGYFEIKIEGLDEDSRLVVMNNKMKIINAEFPEKIYFVQVTEVLTRSVRAIPQSNKDAEQFVKDYKPSNRYNIIFLSNTYPYQCNHYVLSLITSYELLPHLFPATIPAPNEIASIQDLQSTVTWFNKSVRENPEQRKAVENIINKSSGDLPYILYGPPGTGKTATLIEAICQASKSKSCNHILVCTPSNDTADSLTKRLLQYVEKIDLLRIYSLSKDPEKVDKEFIGCSNCYGIGGNKYRISPINVYIFRKIMITTLCSSTRLVLLTEQQRTTRVNLFSFVFIDEAGQVNEPDVIIPFTLLSSSASHHKGRIHGQVVLAGDPQQLGPVVFSRIAKKVLEKSLLERLLNYAPYKRNDNNEYNPKFITKLLRNYRSHQCLINVPSQLFYDEELVCCGDKEIINKALGWEGLPNLRFPMIFKGVYGEEEKNAQSLSFSSFNKKELQAVMKYVHELTATNIFQQKDIGIVTPFSAQKIRLREMLKNEGLDQIEVGTVQLYQGREKDVIILTTVRSQIFTRKKGKRDIGFLSDAKRFNVALTRAKCLMIVVGSPPVLETDENWRALIRYCQQNDAYSDVDVKDGSGEEVKDFNALDLFNTLSISSEKGY